MESVYFCFTYFTVLGIKLWASSHFSRHCLLFKEAGDHVCELMCDLLVSSAMSCVNTDTPALAHMPSQQHASCRSSSCQEAAEVRAPMILEYLEVVGSCVSTVDVLRSSLKNS